MKYDNNNHNPRLSVSTEEEQRGQVKVARENSLDFQMTYFPSSPGYPALPVLMIDKSHRDMAFVKRTPWLAPGKYGTRYSVMWHLGIPYGHPALNVVLSNDETGERKEFWLTICPLQMYILKQQPKVFTELANVVTKTYGMRPKNVPFMLISEQAFERINGRNVAKVMTDPNNQAFFEDNVVMIASCDFSLFCEYFQSVWSFLNRLPPTEPFVEGVSHFPCRYCEISKNILRTQKRIVSREEVKKFVLSEPELGSLLDGFHSEIERILNQKMVERSEQMERGQYK